SSLLGGLLIGLAAAVLWLANGRIAGISGIVGALPSARSGDVAWRVAFLGGLIVSPLLWAALAGPPVVSLEASLPTVIAGGLLVGFGTRLGGGCTSGHGVCGLARFSRRSIVATCVFMVAGFATVFVARHVVGS
ncbi:MAG TPA: YeeE/YedE family protein, partial [Acetobacteraceae bacterium]|nr:YeeE/YedE family protein [Acetobacteraceae bacterium]